MTELELYIQREKQKYMRFYGLVVNTGGIVCFLLLSPMLDYIVFPGQVYVLLWHRIAISIFLSFMVVVVLRTTKEKYFRAGYLISGVAALSTLELMILITGGHLSPYYAGINLTTIFVIGLFPFFSVPYVVVTALLAQCIYALPIFMFDTITNPQVFYSNNLFILFTSGISILQRYLNESATTKMWTLHYELDSHRKQLSSMVDERTKELTKSNQWHLALFNNAKDGILVMDMNGVVTSANERAASLLGMPRESLVGSRSEILKNGADAGTYADRISSLIHGEGIDYEAQHVNREGAKLFIEVNAKAITIDGASFAQLFLRDVTDKKKIQEHLFQAQKMESIGVLAGGIAHDIRNVITAVLGYISSVRTGTWTTDKLTKRSDILERSVRSASALISQLLGYARTEPFCNERIDLNERVGDSVRLFGMVNMNVVGVNVNTAKGLPLMLGDKNQTDNVIINLLNNSRDAIGNRPSGLITVTTMNGKRDGKELVVLEVADNGIGMSADVLSKIYDPYFTTKRGSGGVGLGLSMVYGVVSNAGGHISVESEEGKGTTFRLEFNKAEDQTPIAPSRLPIDGNIKGDEKVLLVDDDVSVLLFTRDMLESNGYTVAATSSAKEAVEYYSHNASAIRMVISDIVMPEMTGVDLITVLAKINPDIKVLFVSAYAGFPGVDRFNHNVDFISKPYDERDLLSKVRTILDAYKEDPHG